MEAEGLDLGQGPAAAAASRPMDGQDAMAVDDGADQGHLDHGTAADEEEEGAAAAEDSDTLKKRWEDEAATVGLLEKRMAANHPTLVAAIAARDAAESKWRESRAPRPVGWRLGKAQAKLDRAFKLQQRTRDELAAFDDECKAQRAKILAKLEQDRDRVSKHRRAVEDLQEEAGAEVLASKGPRASGVGTATCERVCGKLRETGPQFAALVAALPEGTAARSQADALAARLQALHEDLQKATDEAARRHEEYNIADDDARSEPWSESHELADAADDAETTQWQAAGFGRYHRKPGGSDGGTAPAGKLTAPAPLPPRGGQHSSSSGAGLAAPSPATAGSTDGQGMDEEGPRSKHRRGQPPEDSQAAEAAVECTRRELGLQGHQTQSTAAGSAELATAAAGAAGDPRQLAAQHHARLVDALVNRALSKGVQPITREGLELQMLAPEDLRKWADEFLGDDTAW